ncbi:MAG TPA: sulfurtransferase-like selenium metabolism protein YedF [Firmicutes bacterium]|nr:sulfurtransferase-like selenium metabolism protein YedF [Bacillota bacterium]
MVTKVIDARGLACPRPVIEAKKALQQMSSGYLEVIVDNRIALQNLQKMAAQLGLDCKTDAVQENHYVVLIRVGESAPAAADAPAVGQGVGPGSVVVLSSQFMGEGDPVLGQILMKSFVYALTELETVPAKIVLYNSGVKLAITGSESVADLQKLVERGVEVFCCGTCLDYYRLGDELGVGSVSNMYEIAEIMLSAEALIQP